MKAYVATISYTDRRFGPGHSLRVSIHGSGFAIAINKATRIFWKQLDTKNRNDVRRDGLKVEIREVNSEAGDRCEPRSASRTTSAAAAE